VPSHVTHSPAGQGCPCRAFQRPEEGTPGRVKDISAGGIGVLVGRRFTPGAVLAVELPATARAAPRLLLARVIHATPEAGGGWHVGCGLVYPSLGDDPAALP
jgi:PilZ domain